MEGVAGQFVASLNSEGVEGDHLRRWVRLWHLHRGDLSGCPDLLTEINGHLRHYVRRLVPCGIEEMNLPTLPEFYLSRDVVTDDWPATTTGRPVYVHFSAKGEMPLVAQRFLDFILSSEAGDLVECSRSGCGRFFLRTPKRRKYHSDECARGDTARKSMAARREMLQKRRLAKATRLVSKFGKTWPFDWKSRIASAAGTGQKWVTRQVNLGKLPAPSVTRSRNA